ncbi:lytic transglycosylase domain-containing protein [Ureibacillus acetophenoni]|uniref:Transglycosylase protein with SLT domain n=1 Tax=Ureibacillus acetophenoni TaxID=614649 RepID=A0A285U697_9BACL|nr:lytic transglycosylase domain-containing protein [Ureibacillus acetophenoni]SOC37207.1 transglycosylase protein with SLT domain [Ureibacillus acetophenoni]
MVSKKKKKRKPLLTPGTKLLLIIVLIPISITLYYSSFIIWQQLNTKLSFLVDGKSATLTEFEKIQGEFDLKIPEEYLPIYISAGEQFDIPWTLLAAHHRVETRFSTMKSLISPVGAEGHMQFMPCTFVGWGHPTCSGLGKGDIPESEKTNPEVIRAYGGYGVDANGDGKADPFHIEDAIYSAAKYLSASGAKDGNLEKAIFQYNHSEKYVQDVLHFYNQYEGVSRELETYATTNNNGTF